jgi:hypothetical protein
LIPHDAQHQPGLSTCSLHADAFLCQTHPLRSCHRPSLSKPSARQPTTYLCTHRLPSTSQPIHAPQNPHNGPEALFNIHRSPADHRVRLERLRLPSSLLIETASNHLRAFPQAYCPRRFRSRLATFRPSG